MRAFFAASAIVVALVLATAQSSMVAAQKSVCAPIKSTSGAIISPANIPASTLAGLTNRGSGPAMTFQVNLCAAGSAGGSACGRVAAYVSVFNSSSCASFTTVLSRPTAVAGGFQVVYGAASPSADQMSITVMCNATAPAALTTRSGRFATTTNKNGGTTIQLVAYSSVACGAAPAPPSPSRTCSPVSIGTRTVNPASWAPAFLTLDIGFTGQFSWWFSLCDATAVPPSYVQPCNPSGFLVEYMGDTCQNVSFGTMTQTPALANGQLNFQYVSPNNNRIAQVSVGCAYGMSFLTSLSGTFSISNNSAGQQVYVFDLGIQDLCTGAAPTLPPLPPRPPSMSGSGSNNSPSGNSGSSNQPSGGSSNQPSGGSSNQPSGGSSNQPSGGSGSSNQPSGGSMPSGGSTGSGGMPSEFAQ